MSDKNISKYEMAENGINLVELLSSLRTGNANLNYYITYQGKFATTAGKEGLKLITQKDIKGMIALQRAGLTDDEIMKYLGFNQKDIEYLKKKARKQDIFQNLEDNANEIKKDIDFKEKLEKSETKNKYTEEASKNITKESLNFSKDKNDLLIVKDELNSIRVKDYFLLNYNKKPVNAISIIKFANGTTLDTKDIDKLLILNASNKNDEISTISSESFTINAKGGDDVITTNGGDDYIDAGDGNDTVSVIKFKNNLIIYPNDINYYNITKILF